MKGDVCAHLRRTETQHRVAASADGMLVWAQGVRAQGSPRRHGGRSSAPSGLLVLFTGELRYRRAQTTPRLSGRIRSWCSCFLLGDLHKARKRGWPLQSGVPVRSGSVHSGRPGAAQCPLPASILGGSLFLSLEGRGREHPASPVPLGATHPSLLSSTDLDWGRPRLLLMALLTFPRGSERYQYRASSVKLVILTAWIPLTPPPHVVSCQRPGIA